MTEVLRVFLDAPWRVAAATLAVRGSSRVREAVRIRLRDSAGTVGLGEALPLPGYSRDDAAAAEHALATIAARVAQAGLAVPGLAAGGPAAGNRVAARLDAALAPHAQWLAGSIGARFALECALVDLLARRDGVSAAQWLADGRALQPVAVSVLLPDDERSVLAAARAAAARGHGVLKLKIARHDRTAEQEDALLAAVRAAVDAVSPGHGARVRLRLDANGALAPAAVSTRLAALRRHGIELVEEPVAGSAQLALGALPIAWASDESLADPALASALLDLPRECGPAAFVLKPAQLGLARCLVLAEAAAARGIGLIVTHSFDGESGHAAACALAAALPVAPWPCGLAPHAGLPGLQAPQPWLPAPALHGLGVPGAGQAQPASQAATRARR